MQDHEFKSLEIVVFGYTTLVISVLNQRRSVTKSTKASAAIDKHDRSLLKRKNETLDTIRNEEINFRGAFDNLFHMLINDS